MVTIENKQYETSTHFDRGLDCWITEFKSPDGDTVPYIEGTGNTAEESESSFLYELSNWLAVTQATRGAPY